jgi:hypothetical protein
MSLQQRFDEKFGDFYGNTIANGMITTLKATDVKAFITSELKEAINQVKKAQTVDEAVKILEDMV